MFEESFLKLPTVNKLSASVSPTVVCIEIVLTLNRELNKIILIPKCQMKEAKVKNIFLITKQETVKTLLLKINSSVKDCLPKDK